MDERTTASAPASAAQSDTPATWVLVTGAIALFTMATQIRFPVAGGRIGLADVTLGLAFLAVLWDMLSSGRSYRYPVILLSALGLYVLSSLVGRHGRDAAVECVQRFEQLFCAFLVFSLLFRRRRHWIGYVLTGALALNVVVAALQVMTYGYGSVLPPADVLALPWGFGRAHTGLFRDRVALSLFLGIGLAFAVPFWERWASKHLWREAVVVLLAAVALSFAAFGPILIFSGLALVAAGLFAGRRPAIRNGVVVLLTVLLLAVFGGLPVILESTSPFKPGEGQIKTRHADVVAAVRMASQAPVTGVGPGNYQRHIGRCYGKLPNPRVNDIETDTQAGIGILLSTAGYPAGILILLALLAAWTQAGWRYARSKGEEPLVLGAGTALGIILLSLAITDPFIRGPAWFLALGLTVAFTTTGVSRILNASLGLKTTIACGAVYTILAGLIWLIPARDPLANARFAAAGPAITSPAGSLPTTTAVNGGVVPLQSAGGSLDFFRVIDAAAAKTVTPPFEKGTDSQAAKQSILRVPDKKGVPPEGEAPDMKYGGALFEFDVENALTAKIWVRVWWEGSCGNTLFVRLGDDGDPVTVGNDGTYDAWHWLEVPQVYDLQKGTHSLYILNREDGIRFDQMLITNDMDYFPQGIEVE